MAKKYFDENNKIVGISYGEITNNFKETSEHDAEMVINLLANKPKKVGYKVNLVDNGAEDEFYLNYNFEFVEIPDEELPDEALKEKLIKEIMDQITVGSRPAAKEGFSLKPTVNGTSIIWEFVADEKPAPEEDITLGTYINPITYELGMEVKVTKWYTDGNNIWEAIQSGIPADFNDTAFFDIITV